MEMSKVSPNNAGELSWDEGFRKREPSALLHGLWLPKWEGDPTRGNIYSHFTFLYSRN